MKCGDGAGRAQGANAPEGPMSDTPPLVIEERHGNVLLLKLNRPERHHALNRALSTAIDEAVARAESDPDVRVIVLTGSGDRAFCAGMDLRGFAEGDQLPAGAEQGLADFQRLLRGEVTVPLVGAANATALAGGLELLLACDLIVAS